MRALLWTVSSAVLSVALAGRWIQYGDHGEVSVVDGINSWDVTGWTTNNENVSIVDDSVLACIACMSHEPSITCAEAVAPVYKDVCEEGLSSAARKERADSHRVSGDADEWCGFKCDFEHLANRASTNDAGGISETDVKCLDVLLQSCGDDVVFHSEHAQLVKLGSATRRAIMHPFTAESDGLQLTEPVPDADHLNDPAFSEDGEEDEAEMERHAFEHMQHRLDWIMSHRRNEMLPPAPTLCTICQESGLNSTSCRIAVDDLAKVVCIDGDELDFCSGMGLGCTPYPEGGGPAARIHDLMEHAPEDPEEAKAMAEQEKFPHATGKTGPLSMHCASLVERPCMFGLVMPGKNSRHINHPLGLHRSEPAFTSEDVKEAEANKPPRLPHEEL